jgi:hypothetical protein
MKHWLFFFLVISAVSYAAADEDFDALMGKKTKHWEFVSQEKDRAFLAFTKQIYEKNKEAQNQYQPNSNFKIPPVIHFIWLGPKHFPPESVENVRTWIVKHPGWTVKFWTDRPRPAPVTEMQVIDVSSFAFQTLGRQFHESENWGEKSDILRYEILFQEGGTYVDHDANCLRSFVGLHKAYDFYCGLEAPHEAFVGRNITCGNGVIGARAGHPTIERVIGRIEENWDGLKKKFRGKDPHSKIEIVMQRTYIALTHSLEGTMNLPGNMDIVLPSGYFFAKSGIPSLFSQHFYATSWDDFRHKKSETDKIFEKMVNKLLHDARSMVRNVLLVLLLQLIIVVLVVKLFQVKEKAS